VKVGSTQQWKFSDVLQVDALKPDLDFDEDERPPFLVPLSERCLEKLTSNGVKLPEFLQAKAQVAEQAVAEVKENARIHYDKEDLISFHQLFISKPLAKAAQDLDFEHPTVIQRQTIPAIIEGNDILAHAVTGSGKTASYLLPILEKWVRAR
jgi:ATP-dependent helicase YprA (DUF1998 family)